MALWEKPKVKLKKPLRGWEIDINPNITFSPTYYADRLRLTEKEKEYRRSMYAKNYLKAKRDFESKTSLTAFDFSFLFVAATLQTMRWILLNKMRFSSASDADRIVDNARNSLQNAEYVPSSLKQIGASMLQHQVPYDAVARSERFKEIYPDLSVGLSGNTHRVRALGHDPLLGLIFGTANIATNTVTINDIWKGLPSYHVDPVTHQIYSKTDIGHILKWNVEMLQTEPTVVGAAFVRQIIHIGTDAFTIQGVPLPVINNIDPEFSRFLIGKQVDLYKVGGGVLLSILINKLVEMLHRLFFKKGKDDERLYEVRTRKIILYSNTMSSLLNVAVVGSSGNIKQLDVGGLIVTLHRIFSDTERIREIKAQFVNETLDGILKKEEDEVNNRLSAYGYSIESLLKIN